MSEKNKIKRLEEALEWALMVIDSYEVDIRNSEHLGIDLEAKGFCQGHLYREAQAVIRRKAGIEGESPKDAIPIDDGTD